MRKPNLNDIYTLVLKDATLCAEFNAKCIELGVDISQLTNRKPCILHGSNNKHSRRQYIALSIYNDFKVNNYVFRSAPEQLALFH